MPDQTEQRYRVNELTPDPSVAYDPKVAEQYLRYARMLSARGLVHSSTGNLVMRISRPQYPQALKN